MRRMKLWVSGFAIIVSLSCGGGGKPVVEEDAQNDGPLPDDILTEEQDVPVVQDKEDVLDVDVAVDPDALVEEDDGTVADDAVTDDDQVDQDAVVYPDFEKQDCSGIAPALATTLTLSDLSMVATAALSGRYAYLHDIHNRLLTVDLIDPAAPTVVGSIELDFYAKSIAVSGERLYVSGYYEGLAVYDTSDPTSLKKIGEVHFFLPSWESKTNGTVVAIRVSPHDLLLVDVSDPAMPTLMTVPLLTDIADFAFVGDMLYASPWSAGSFLYAVDLSAPEAPVVDTVTLSIPTYQTKLAAEDDRLFVAQDGAFHLFDITDRMAPQLLGTGSYAGAFTDGLKKIIPASSRVYLSGADMGYAVMDIADPTEPALIFSDNPGIIKDIFEQGDRYFVAGETMGLRVYSTAFPQPAPVAELAPFWAIDLAVNGSYLYVAGVYGGIAVVDMSDPLAPQVAARYDDPEGAYEHIVFSEEAERLVANDPISSELVFFSLTDPETLQEETRLSISPIRPVEMVALGKNLYIVDEDYGVTPIDMTAPQNIGTRYLDDLRDIAGEGTTLVMASESGLLVYSAAGLIPSSIGHLDLPGGSKVAISGATAYLLDVDNIVHVIDMADPTTPVEKGSFILPRTEGELSASGTMLFSANYRYEMSDISSPLFLPLPELVGSESSLWMGMTAHAEVGSAHIFLTGIETIQVFDITPPPTPVEIAVLPLAEPTPQLIQTKEHLYIPAKGALSVFSLAAPGHPEQVALLENTNLSKGEMISCGDRIFISDAEYSFKSVHQVDISIPSDPEYRSTEDLPFTASSFACQGDHLFIASRENEVVVFETSSSGLFSQIGELSLSDSPVALAVSGETVVVLTRENSLMTVDVSDKETPVLITEIPLPGFGLRLSIEQNHAAIMMPFRGIALYDIADPAMPLLEGVYTDLIMDRADIQLTGDLVLVADEYYGQKIVDFSDPAQPRLLSAGTYSVAADVATYDGYLYSVDDSVPTLVTVKPLLCQ